MVKAALECWTRELACHLGPEGHRVNAISSGPIRTIAASGIPGFENILDHVEKNAPLRRNVSQEDVAGATLWLGEVRCPAASLASVSMSMQGILLLWCQKP